MVKYMKILIIDVAKLIKQFEDDPTRVNDIVLVWRGFYDYETTNYDSFIYFLGLKNQGRVGFDKIGVEEMRLKPEQANL